MQISILIAKMFAVFYLFIGLGMLMDPKHYKKMVEGVIKDPTLLYYGGFMATMSGFLIVYFHHVWQGWPLLITVFGWLAFLKGFILFVFPGFFTPWMKYFKKINMTGIGIFVLALGILFGYLGWFM